MPSRPTLYELLGLSRNATPEEMRQAYRAAAMKLHPDVNSLPGQTELFIDVQEAYDILSDPEKRAVYDSALPEERPVPKITAYIRLSRQSLAHSTERQVIYALVELIAPALDAPGVPFSAPALNLCMVIDRSTSMRGTRMDMVKAGAIELVQKLRRQDIFSLVAFSDRAEVLQPASNVEDAHRLASPIRLIHPGGGTEIYHGLKAGLDEIRHNLSADSVNHLLLITDGRTYGDEAACLELAGQAAESGIGISSLGIGSEWNDEFLDELAARTAGAVSFVSHPGDLSKHLQAIFSGLANNFAQQVQLQLSMHPQVCLQEAFRFEPGSARLPLESRLLVGSLPYNARVSILLQCVIEPLPQATQTLNLFEGKLEYQTCFDSRICSSVPVEVVIPVLEQPEASPTPQDVLQAVQRLTLYKMQEQARYEAESGEVDKASLRLQRLAVHLSEQGNPEFASTVLMQVAELKQSGAISTEGQKKIKYGTRALLLPPSIEDTPG